MPSRRAFIASAGAAAAGFARAREQTPQTIKGIAFDGFPIIDPRPVAARAEQMFPGRGEALASAWRTRQFEYSWLRTLTDSYADFWQVTRDALVFAALSLGLPLGPAAREELLHTYLELRAWSDVRPALEALRKAGIRMAFLSNLTAPMLDAAIESPGLHGFFEPHLTTDRVRAFKPDRRAYAMGPSAFGARADEVAFCASAGWDAVGAKRFGYRTFWLNRANQPLEELGVKPDGIGTGMADFVRFVLAS
jgi:2-haloacid dehalogenase